VPRNYHRINDHTNSVTPMLNGRYRAECLRADCGDWCDFPLEDEANAWMREHNQAHGDRLSVPRKDTF
jgi:hypothetical protein